MKVTSILLQIFLFLAMTFVFIVLIDHGPQDFPRNAATEWGELTDLVLGSDS